MICPTCNKPDKEFHKDKGRSTGLCYECTECSKVRRSKYYQKNRARILEVNRAHYQTVGYSRKHHLSKKYKITLDDYDKMFEAQHGKCAICGEEGKLFVDHNHETGRIRKLLCHRCNAGIGFFLESTKNLQRAILYLEEHA